MIPIERNSPAWDFMLACYVTAGNGAIAAVAFGCTRQNVSHRLRGWHLTHAIETRRVRNYSHGTRYGYASGCRCELCMEANAAAHRSFTARHRGTLAPDDPRHGSENAYTNYACRCDVCRVAHGERMNNRRHLIREDRHGTSTNYSYGCRCEACRAWCRENAAKKRRAA